MSAGHATKDAEALRYRLIVRLALVAREAESQGRNDVAAQARTIRERIEAIVIGPDDAEATAAKERLLAEAPAIEKLQTDIGLPDHGMAVYPKWLRFAVWASPALIGLGALAWIIERRRKKKEVSAADIEQLEQTMS